jgi:hypothetical protein
MRHFEQSLAAVAGTGLALPARFELIAAVDDYVSGNSLHAVESLARAKIAEEEPEMVAAAVAYGISRLQTGDFPQLSAIAAASTQTAEPPGPPMTETALTGQTRAPGPARRPRRAHEPQLTPPRPRLTAAPSTPSRPGASKPRVPAQPAGGSPPHL